MVWQVYVLLSADGASTYVGVTTALDRRLAQHNGDRPGGAKSTRSGRPWSVGAVYGPFEDRSEAQQVEWQVKQLSGRERFRWSPKV